MIGGKAKLYSSTLIITLVFSMIIAPINMGKIPVVETKGTPLGWTDDINLSNNSTAWDQYPSICTWNDTVHVTWINDDGVLYRKSDDGGRSWSSAITLYQTGFFSIYTDIDVSGQNVHAVWGDREGWDGIYYRNSTDGGDTWSPVKRISSNGVDANGPLVYVNNSNVHIIWWDERDGANGEIYYRRSLDGGITWDNGQGVDVDRRVTFSPAATGNIAFAGSGSNLSVIWSDERNGNFDIYWMISKDNGNTWEDGLGTPDVGRQLTADATDSMWNAIAMNGSDIHIVWMDESWPGPAYRIYYRNSTDLGVTWNPIKLLTGPSPLMASPDIAIYGNFVHLTWDDARDDGSTMEIYYKNSTDSGISWGGDTRLTYNEGNNSYHPKIAPTESMVHVTWWDERDGLAEIYYKRFPEFPLIDSEPPAINHIPVISANVFDVINITANITDNVSVNQVYLNYTSTNGTNYNISMNQWSGNWSYDIPDQNNIGFVDYFIWANDTSSNTNMTSINQIQIIEEITPAQIEPDSIALPIYPRWNLISLPLEPLDKGPDGKFTAYDFLQEVEADLGQGIYTLAKFDGGNPAHYTVFTSGDLEGAANDFVMNNVDAYWLYSPGPSGMLNIPGQNITNWGNGNVKTLQPGWNLCGFPHNISVGGGEPGGWNTQLMAHHFTDGTVDADLKVGVADEEQIIATAWIPKTQHYQSWVVNQTYSGYAPNDWTYDSYYSGGYWLWVNSSIEVTFDTEF